MTSTTTLDLACDLWIIRQWQAQLALRSGQVKACNALLSEELHDESQGYGLPADYTCGPRLHAFAGSDCEVWLCCVNPAWTSAQNLIRLLPTLVDDQDMEWSMQADGDSPFVLALNSRSVTGAYRMEGANVVATAY